MRLHFLLAAVLVAPTAQAQAKPETTAAFDRYVTAAEARIQLEQSAPASFVRLNSLTPPEHAAAEKRLHAGEVVVEKIGQTPQQVPGGLVHDWIGTAFLPGATVQQVLATVQDYDHLPRFYSPEVKRSKLLVRQGDDFRISMRLREHKVVTVVLDTEYDVHYGKLDAQHWFSISRSTRIQEVADPDTASERAGESHGFLWRLNTYWRFVQAADGVYVQCEAISLTRDIPTGLGWLVRPFIENIPPESLTFTMRATAEAVRQQQHNISAGLPAKKENL